MEAPSATSVALALSMAVLPKNKFLAAQHIDFDWPCQGLAKAVHLDNAREFHSNALKRGCEEHGIEISFRPPGRPHFGGHIERLIGTMMGEVHLSSCTLRPEWTWFVIKGVRSISANVVVLIDRIIVLNDRKISPRPLCNAKCQIRTRLPFILEMFTKLSSSVLTSPLYRTPPKTPSRQCNASGACGTVRALRTIPSGC